MSEELDAQVRRLIETEAHPSRQVASVVRLAGEDGAAGWRSLVEDIGRVLIVAEGRERWALAKAQTRAVRVAKHCDLIVRDLTP